MITKLYTENQDLSEREFLLREMGLLLTQIDPNNATFFAEVKSAKPVFIATTSPEVWLPFLQRRPPQSVVLLLLGNETYEKRIYDSIRDLSSIITAFIYGFPKSGRVALCIGGFFGEMIDSSNKTVAFFIQSIRNLRTGILKQRQVLTSHFKYPIHSFPQGYSNSFAIQISRKITDLGAHESLINSTLVQTLAADAHKTFRFGFVGQIGGTRRQDVLKLMKRYSSSNLLIKNQYGGNNISTDDSYIEMLLSSEISVIPPGNFNIYNHRYIEALILNLLPLIVSNVATDGFKNQHWSNSLKFLPRFSYRFLFAYCLNLSGAELARHISKAKTVEFGFVSITRRKIDAFRF